MKKLLLILVIVVLVAGCVKTHEVKTGQSKAYIGEVRVEKALTHIGSIINDSWVVQADENGNAIISAGKGSLDLIPFYLSTSARAEFASQLNKLFEWGNISAKEKIETNKHVGSISTKTGFLAGDVIVHTSFISISEGKSWFGKIDFCQLQSQGSMIFGTTRPIGSDPCVKKSDFFLSPDSVMQLVKYLDAVPEHSNKASASKSKSDMLK